MPHRIGKYLAEAKDTDIEMIIEFYSKKKSQWVLKLKLHIKTSLNKSLKNKGNKGTLYT